MGMTRIGMLSLCVLLGALVAGQVAMRRPIIKPGQDNQCLTKLPRCGLCGKSVSVTIVATNHLVEPEFSNSITVGLPQGELIYFLEKAADMNGMFNFSASYHSHLGYMINTINHVTADMSAKTYWEIFSMTTETALACGVSRYVPKDKEVMLFNFTTYE